MCRGRRLPSTHVAEERKNGNKALNIAPGDSQHKYIRTPSTGGASHAAVASGARGASENEIDALNGSPENTKFADHIRHRFAPRPDNHTAVTVSSVDYENRRSHKTIAESSEKFLSDACVLRDRSSNEICIETEFLRNSFRLR